ncbi:LexA family transcriptional regulator [Sinirhodobacter hankyongi]|uniref:LexA family transcriptional regulator n=2 Tax=Paenirhodobacter hankyongi TaxID=2294033 RepID=A0A421BJ80_9RHOB|nr:LexA family transcriptional regulator [Sinirhodobacter hankyongi]
METTFKLALDHALAETGKSLRSIAIAAGVSYEQLKNLKQGKSQTTNVDDARKVAAAFGVSLDDFYAGQLHSSTAMIAVAGRVGAGAEVELVDAFGKGNGLFHVACPPQLNPHGIVAVEVEGDSMSPAYPPGTILFYSRDALGVPTEAIGRVCVCEDVGGRAWVKHIKPGLEEGTFSLISLNPHHDPQHGIRLQWAAPVKFSLPPEFVKRIE